MAAGNNASSNKTVKKPRSNKPAATQRTAKRSSSTTRKRSRAKSQTPIRVALLKLLLLLLMGFIVIAGFWVWTLNQQVISGFAIKQTQVSSHLYSRPYEIQAGDSKQIEHVIDELQQRGYHQVGKINEPKQFARSQSVIDIFTSDTRQWNAQLQAQAVRITFANNVVSLLTDHQTGHSIESLELAPVLIGNLNSGPIQDRLEIQLHQAPELLLDAVLTMEDRRFTEHNGVDFYGIARAVVSHIKPGARRQGGSTLTQQLVKNIYLDPSRTLKRKLKEAVMAVLVEHHFDKSQILERYLNTIFLGQSGNRAIHGFALAAQYYFNRDLSDLEAGQLATLVGMIPAPSANNPLKHPKRALKRRNLVLSTLANNGFITQSQAQLYQAKDIGADRQHSAQHDRYPAFIDLLSEQMEEVFDPGFLTTTEVNLFTTLDAHIQQKAEKAFKQALSDLETQKDLPAGFLQGAMMVIKPESGEIVAIIGGSDNQAAGFNRALHARRPVGSLIKPAVYLTALQNPERYSLVTPIEDQPIAIPLDNGEVWQPQNYDNEYHGSPSLYESLAQSYNIPAVTVGLEVGLDNVLTTLKRLGIKSDLTSYPSLTLGAVSLSVYEIAQMYQTIANKGHFMPLRTLKAVAYKQGDVITQHQPKGEQVFNPAAMYLLLTALQEATLSGTARALSGLLPNISLAGKTGTTNDYRDSWFAGFGQNYLGIVWIGNDANKPTGLTGSSGALRIWAKVMQDIDIQSIDSDSPSNVVFTEVDALTGDLAKVGCTQQMVTRAFIKGYEPTSNALCDKKPTLGNWIGKWLDGVKKPKQTKKPLEGGSRR